MRGSGMTSLGGADPRFPPTRWGEILAARDPDHAEYRPALEDLIRRYWKPVYAYVRFQWSRDNEKAKDLTQAFFTTLLEKAFLKDVDPGKGSFRAFLKAAVQNFLRKSRRDERRLKRGGGVFPVPFEEAPELPSHASDPAKNAEEAFDRAWKAQVLEHAIADLRAELVSGGRLAQWHVFETIVLADEKARPTYEEVARRLRLRVTDVTNHLHAARKRLKKNLRRTLIESLARPEDLDEEWRSVLGAGPLKP